MKTLPDGLFYLIKYYRQSHLNNKSSCDRSSSNQKVKNARAELFYYITLFLSRFKRAIDIGFSCAKKKSMHPIEMAGQLMVRDAVTGVYPHFKTNYSAITFSRGILDQATRPILCVLTGGCLSTTWETAALKSKFSKSTDEMVLMVYNETQKQCRDYVAVADRRECMAFVKLPYFNEGDILHCWIFFMSPDKKRVSDTQYLNQF